MNTQNKLVFKYVLPSGTVVGYHANATCGIGSRAEAAVFSGPLSAEEHAALIRENFKIKWRYSSDEFRKDPIWQGASFCEIKIVAEAA